jgi:Bacterial Ig domain/Calcineurin-like phosphoesterase
MLVFGLIPAAASETTTLTFGPDADATIRADEPDATGGTGTKLSADNSPVLNTLMRFSVTGVGSDHVQGAKLRLYNVNPSNVGGVFARVADNTWSETGVTWNTAPTADPIPLVTLGPVALNTLVEVDLTKLVTSDGTFSLRISSTSTDGAGYTSREGTATLRPQLVVTTAPADTAAPTVTITSPADGSTVTGVVIVTVDASDDVGVMAVDLSVDGTPFGTDTTGPYSLAWDSRAVANGSHVLVATARDAAGHATQSLAVSVSVANASDGSFTFAAAGDHGANQKTAASLASLDTSGASFYLALGDLDYNQTTTDSAWCDYVHARLPTLGPTFPFELVSGNHEEQGALDGYILNSTACLPDRMGSTVGPGSVYGAEYTFDYPESAPLMRVIMIAPGLTIENTTYDYVPGSPHYDWLKSEIEGARAAGIPWVAVGMHYPCYSAGRYGCGLRSALWSLLVQEKVDLVLNGHDHNYQRSKQFALDPTTCPSIPSRGYAPGCVVDDGVDGVYPKGAGAVNVIAGSFGQALYRVSLTDPEAPNFSRIDGSTNGFMQYAVTASRIDARFVNTTGAFTDAFSIVAGAIPAADRSPPVAPTNLSAVVMSDTHVDLTWSESTDDVGVARYGVFRDSVLLGTTTTTSYSDTTAMRGLTYAYMVRAYDAANNQSDPSASVPVVMPGVGTVLYFGPTSDATIEAASPTTNFGASSKIEVDNSPVTQGLMRFTVSGVGTGVVLSAKLRLYNVNPSSTGGSFYPAPDNGWTESGVTWNTAPTAGVTPVATLGPVTSGTWYEVDVTSLITGDGTYCLRITTPSSDGADYISKDGTSGFRPQLVVSIQ